MATIEKCVDVRILLMLFFGFEEKIKQFLAQNVYKGTYLLINN